MRGSLAPDQRLVALIENWESFLGKLSIPVPEEVLSAGELCARYLSAVSISMYTQSPRTLMHHDVQGTTSWSRETAIRRSRSSTGS
jgi:hypothetical protein